MEKESLKEKTAKGLLWGGLANGMQQVIGIVFGIILGRLLSQPDYGMIAMTAVFIAVATSLQESGFRAALTNLRDPQDRDYNSVFWFNISVGTGLYALLFVCAPLIGRYYHTDKIVPLCRYASLSIVLSSLGTAQFAYLFKNLRAKQQAKASILSTAVSSVVGVTMAFMGMSYWSLATQSLVFVGMNTLLMWHYSPWRPSVHGITFAPVRRMFRFSFKLLATNIIINVNNNILNILLGRHFTPHDVGNYNQAYQWTSKCYYVVQGMVSQVSQPTLVGLGDDRARQLNALRKMVRFTAFVCCPLLFGFGLVCREFIVLTITEKWLQSAGMMQLLCFSAITMPISVLLSNMIISHGKSGVYFWSTFCLGTLQIVTMALIWPFGIYAMVVAYVVLNVAWMFVWQLLVKRLSGYRLRDFVCDVLPFVFAAFGVMALVHFATSMISNLLLLLASRVFLGVALYYIVMRLCRVKMLDECMGFILKKKVK